jgi:hypothetical protein
MALRIETFSNIRGGNAFFKAVTHPLAAAAMTALLERLAGRAVALVDPDGVAEALGEIHDLKRLGLTGVYVQDVAAIGRVVLGRATQPVTALRSAKADAVLVASFDPRIAEKLASLLPPGAEFMTLDSIRLPDALLSNPARYLDGINFATNFVFFRDADGLHTRLATGNYWSGYGASEVALWLALYDRDGKQLAQWREPVASDGAILIDSGAVRARFGLPEFTGQLFLHATGIAGHDAVKYALDIYGEGAATSLSCTHDANSWPADFYAGLPAPDRDERVTLWIQNSLPCPIPAGAVGLNLMGHDESRPLDQVVPPFASKALDVGALWPEARWPQQFEVSAGKYCVRPRYEVERRGKRRIAHVNVERTDLQPDPGLPQLNNLMGKGYLLPAPILPRDRWRTIVQPTPMARAQKDMPLALLVYDAAGTEAARMPLGRLRRDESIAVDIDHVLDGATWADGFGHLELVYDFAQGGSGDGWLHALFRYEDRAGGHQADSSFGAHIFNTALTYRDEPQSYSGRPPGLSTRLYLRLGDAPYDTLCHLIYPASTPWLPESTTDLLLYDQVGREVAKRRIAIPCSGSRFWRYGEMFDAAERERAAAGGYILIRDVTCRLFGYHGLLGSQGEFSLDHMFGF